MNGRERINNILDGKSIDRISWTTIADEVTRSEMPDHLRNMPLLEFYRHIGCDVFQFGNSGLPEKSKVIYPYNLICPQSETVEYNDNNGVFVKTQITEWGTLVAKYKKGHPIKYPIETLDDLRILKKIWQNSQYSRITERVEESYQAAEDAIGNSGIYVPVINQP